MASPPELELDRKALEKGLKLAKLEADFYRANSATRKESIELDNIRNCLLQELVEIEENKNLELRNEIQEIQLERGKEREEVARLRKELEVARERSQNKRDKVGRRDDVEQGDDLGQVAELVQRDQDVTTGSLLEELEGTQKKGQREIPTGSVLEELESAREKDQKEIARLKDELKSMTVMYTLSEQPPVRSAKVNAITVLHQSSVKKKRLSRNNLPLGKMGPGRGRPIAKQTSSQGTTKATSETLLHSVRGHVAKGNHLSTESREIVGDEDQASTAAVKGGSRRAEDDSTNHGTLSTDGAGGDGNVNGDGEDHTSATAARRNDNMGRYPLVEVQGSSASLMEERSGLTVTVPLTALAYVPEARASMPQQSGVTRVSKQSLKPPRFFPSGKRIGRPPRIAKDDTVTPPKQSVPLKYAVSPHSGKRLGRPPKVKRRNIVLEVGKRGGKVTRSNSCKVTSTSGLVIRTESLLSELGTIPAPSDPSRVKLSLSKVPHTSRSNAPGGHDAPPFSPEESELELSESELVMVSGRDGQDIGSENFISRPSGNDSLLEGKQPPMRIRAEGAVPRKKRGRPLKLNRQQDNDVGGASAVSVIQEQSESALPRKKRGRPPKLNRQQDDDIGNDISDAPAVRAVMQEPAESTVPRKKRGRPPKLKWQGADIDTSGDIVSGASTVSSRVSAVLPEPSEGTVPQKKRGRPPKLNRQDADIAPSEGTVPQKKRGRPPKLKTQNIDTSVADDSIEDTVSNFAKSELAVPPRKRGRPKKLKVDPIVTNLSESVAPLKKRGRGRPRKQRIDDDDEEDDVTAGISAVSEEAARGDLGDPDRVALDASIGADSAGTDGDESGGGMATDSDGITAAAGGGVQERLTASRESASKDGVGCVAGVAADSADTDDAGGSRGGLGVHEDTPSMTANAGIAADSANTDDVGGDAGGVNEPRDSVGSLASNAGVSTDSADTNAGDGGGVHEGEDMAEVIADSAETVGTSDGSAASRGGVGGVTDNAGVSADSAETVPVTGDDDGVPEGTISSDAVGAVGDGIGTVGTERVVAVNPEEATSTDRTGGVATNIGASETGGVGTDVRGVVAGTSAETVVDPQPAPRGGGRPPVTKERADTDVPSKVEASPRIIGWSLRNKRVVAKGIASRIPEFETAASELNSSLSPVVRKKRGRPRKLKEQAPETVIVSTIEDNEGTSTFDHDTTPELATVATKALVEDIAKPPQRKRGRPPKLKSSVATDGAPKKGVERRIPKPIGSYYTISKSSESGGIVVKKLGRPIKGAEEVVAMADDGGKPGTDSDNVPEADDLPPPAKKRAVGAKESPDRPKDRPIKEKSKAPSANNRPLPVANLVSSTRLEGAANYVGGVGGVAVAEASKDRVMPGSSKQSREAEVEPSEASDVTLDNEASVAVGSLTATLPGKEEREHNEPPHPKSPPPKPVASGRPGRPPKPKKVDVASGKAVEAQKQRQPKKTNQGPKGDQSVPMSSLKDSVVQGGATGETDSTESPLAGSAETSEATGENDGKVTGSSSSMLGKRSANHSTRNRADPSRSYDRDKSPEIPLQNMDSTTPKKSPSCKVKKRKTLESVLTTLLVSKLSKNGEEISPEGNEGQSLATGQMVAGLVPSDAGGLGSSDAGDPKKDRRQEKTGPVRKRKTLVGKQARGKAEAFKLSVVDEERYAERNTTIKLNTSTLVPPKLKVAPNLMKSAIPSNPAL